MNDAGLAEFLKGFPRILEEPISKYNSPEVTKEKVARTVQVLVASKHGARIVAALFPRYDVYLREEFYEFAGAFSAATARNRWISPAAFARFQGRLGR